MQQQPQSRIPKLTPRSRKEDEPVKNASPRVSKLPTPKTITPRTGIRKSTSQVSSNRIPTPPSPKKTKPSISESAIPKKAMKTSIKPPSSPKSASSLIGLKQPTKTSLPRLKTKEPGAIPKTLAPSPKKEDEISEDGFEQSLEDLSDAIFERVCGSESAVIPLTDQQAPPGFSDSDSSESLSENPSIHTYVVEKNETTCYGVGDEDSAKKKPPIVPPLDLALLDDFETAMMYEVIKDEEIARVKEEKLLEELEKLEDVDDKRLAKEKQQLLDDMQSLKEKLEQQQNTESRESSSDKEQELEGKLKAKQDEVDSVNQKFADLLDDQQKLLTKVSEQSASSGGFGKAFLVAVLAVLLGVGYLLLQNS